MKVNSMLNVIRSNEPREVSRTCVRNSCIGGIEWRVCILSEVVLVLMMIGFVS